MAGTQGKSLHIRPWLSKDCNQKRKSKRSFLSKLKLSLDSMILSDQINSQIRSTMNFGNLTSRNFTACVYPGLILERNVVFPGFPTYLGKIGSMNKVKRFTNECKHLFSYNPKGK
jgi:hypothetical protein